MSIKPVLDENGHVKLDENGNVVYDNAGKQIAYDLGSILENTSKSNAEAAARRKELEALTAKLAEYEGIDPEKARSALDLAANLDSGKLIEAGKVEELKVSIGKSYEATIADLRKAKDESEAKHIQQTADQKKAIHNLLAKGVFESSAFLREKTFLTPDIAFAAFGKHFEVQEENGELSVVATIDGQPVFSTAKPGTIASPEEAVQAIIERYPMKDGIMRPLNGGSGSSQSTAGGKGHTISKSDPVEFGKNLEAIATGKATVA